VTAGHHDCCAACRIQFEYLSIWSLVSLMCWPAPVAASLPSSRRKAKPDPGRYPFKCILATSADGAELLLRRTRLCRPADGAATSAFAIGRLKRDTEKSSSRLSRQSQTALRVRAHRACSHISTSAATATTSAVVGAIVPRLRLSRSRVRRRRERLHAIDKALVLIRQWTGACASKRAIACSTTATIERRLRRRHGTENSMRRRQAMR